MNSVFLVAALLVGASAERASTSAKRKLIINGDSVAASDHQFFVRSAFDDVAQTDDLLCGASLIHPDIIVTAAHCHGGFNYGAMAYDPNTERFTQYRPVDMQIAYPRYYEDINVINYDLMILRLSSPITNVEPIGLNSDPAFPLFRTINGEERSYLLDAFGVGLTESGTMSRGLEAGFFRAMSNARCGDRLGKNNVGKRNVVMTDDVMCADPSTDDSICAGDSGGPLAARISVSTETNAVSRSPWDDDYKPLLVGVTTFGNDCLVDAIPDGFSRISFYYKWIKEQICNYSQDPPSDCLDYFESDEYSEFLASQDTSNIMDDKVLITMKFQHDFMAEQTTFVFRNTATNKIEYNGPQYVPERGEYVETEFFLPAPGNYAVEIYDTKGDGLTNPKYAESFPQGNWAISAEYSNGARIEDLASGDFNFANLQERFISLPRRKNNDGSTPDPSDLTPTVLPTAGEEVDTETLKLGSLSSSSTISMWGLATLLLTWTTFLLLK